MRDEPGGRFPASAAVIGALLALLLPPLIGFVARGGVSGLGPLAVAAALTPVLILAYLRGHRGAWVGGVGAVGTSALAGTLAGELLFADLGRAVVTIGVFAAVSALLGLRLRKELRQAETMALTDHLTRLPNQRNALAFLERQFAAAERGTSLTIALFDLDHFKRFNDEAGHAAGDRALRVFAEILEQNTRRMNLSARIGGEEFLAILSDSSIPGALTFTERVRRALADRDLDDRRLSVSVGIAQYHPAMKELSDLLAAADNALYQAKHDGRDCIRVFGGTAEADTSPAVDPAVEAQARPGRELHDVLVIHPHGPRLDALLADLRELGLEPRAADTRAAGLALAGHRPELVIVDLQIIDHGGPQACRALKARWPGLPVAGVLSTLDAGALARAVAAGADRHLIHPFTSSQLAATIEDLRSNAVGVEPDSSEESGFQGEALLMKLSDEAESLEEFSAGHGHRVQSLAIQVGEHMREAGERLDLRSLSIGARAHDVGRLSVGSRLLNKVLPLTPGEYGRIHTHPIVGQELSRALLPRLRAHEVVRWHTEHWDGSGYPDGLAGKSIPLEARIVGVVEALDAMTTYRRYRPPLAFDQAVEQLRQRAGAQFDPAVVAVVESLAPALEATLTLLRSGGPAKDAGSRSAATR